MRKNFNTLVVLIFICVHGFAQDEFIFRSSGEKTGYKIKITKVTEDSLHYIAFRRNEVIALKDIMGYRIDSLGGDEYVIPNSSDSSFFNYNSLPASRKESKLPVSMVNIGIGCGMNYGILGTKTVFGYKNSGLMIGLGIIPGGLFGYEVGGQFSYEFLYCNIGYGVFGTEQYLNEPATVLTAGGFHLGTMIGIGKAKQLFIDLNVGHTFGAPKRYIWGINIEMDVWNANIGIGYRFGSWKK